MVTVDYFVPVVTMETIFEAPEFESGRDLFIQ